MSEQQQLSTQIDDELISQLVAGATGKEGAEPEATEEVKDVKPQPSKLDRFEAKLDKEKVLRDKESQVKQKQQELAAKEEAWKSRAKENPVEVIKELGIDYNKLVEQMLDLEPSMTKKEAQNAVAKLDSSELRTIKDELKALKEEREREKQAQAQVSAQETKQAEEDFRNDIRAAIDEEEFPYAVATADEDEIAATAFEVAVQHFKETEEILDPKDALLLVEAYYKEKYERVNARLSKKDGNFKKAIIGNNKSTSSQSSKSSARAQRTLSNAQTKPVSLKDNLDLNSMTPEERIEHLVSKRR